MLRLMACALLFACVVQAAQARALHARIARVVTPVAVLEGVRVHLDWPAQAKRGALRLQAARVDAPDLGYRFRDLDWRCPLQRDNQGAWRCAGELRSGRAAPLQLSIDLGIASTDAKLSRGKSAVTVHRSAASPEFTYLELTQVPMAWAQALMAQAWTEGRITGGTVDGKLSVQAAAHAALRIEGPLKLRGGSFDTPDGTIAAENLGADLEVDMALADTTRAVVDGHLRGGELLFGTAYISLQQRDVAIGLEALRQGEQGWQLPRIAWNDQGILQAQGSAVLSIDAALDALDIQVDSHDLAPLRDAYLTGWLGVAGLPELELSGRAAARVTALNGAMDNVEAKLDHVTIHDPLQRFAFESLDGDVKLSSRAQVRSQLEWQAGALYGLSFGAAQLPFVSSDGELRFGQAVTVPMLGGRMRLDHLRLRPPGAGRGLDVRFGLTLQQLDVAQLAAALEWPAFTGELSGDIPQAHYAAERLDFDGGLQMQVFDGRVAVSALSMERPFGVAPTLSADIAFDDLDLEGLTGVFGFGAITGRLDGRIGGLRMVDWQPVAFDAQMHSDRAAARRLGTPQRISQRAVQDLSSVGDASFVNSLQSRLIGLFDDFGYARIGIACQLAEEICRMDGLGSAGRGFIIVEGSGVPRLSVIGFNRLVDWPTLLERLGAIGKGDVAPVVE